MVANITDNDTAGVIINTPVAVSEGDNTVGDTYTVVLTSEPTANVTVSFDGGGQLSNSPDLIFTPLDWNTPQVVTVFAVDDNVAEGTHFGTVTHTATSADGNYNGIPIDDVTATITDNDTQSLIVTPLTLGVNEGGTNTFSVRLAAQPTADVTVSVANTAGDTDLSVSGGASLTFTTANWDTTQDVTLTAAEDPDAINGTATFTLSSSGLTNVDVTADEIDNDTQSLIVTPLTLGVNEGGTNTFSVKLAAQPTADVTVSVANTAGDTDLSVSGGATLTFTTTNWDTTQDVTLTAAEDPDANNGTATFTLSSSGLTNVDVTVDEIDNDTAGVIINTPVAVSEGDNTVGDSYNVVLTSEPTADVTISFNGGGQLNNSPDLVFTALNWNTPQDVTVFAVDDSVAEGTHVGTVTHTAASTDGNYNGIQIDDVTATITDNDFAGVTITESDGTTDVSEGGATDSYDVVLDSQPETGTTVTITIATTDGQTTTTPTSLLFDDTNWNVAQSVTVTAVDDASQEGSPHTGSITHTAVSTDTNYDGISIASVTANIADNDTAGVTINTPVAVTEGDNTVGDSYNVVLTSEPTADVTISFNGGGQLNNSPDLVFTALNWNTPQDVTVFAVDDSVAEGTHVGTVTHTAASTDGNYNGIQIDDVTATITDNDFAGVTITESDGTTDVSEGGATDSYDVVLDSQPETGTTVTITIATTDGQTTTTPTSLLFDDTNWNVAQSVTVTAVDDAAQEGSPHTGSITHTAVSTDANYDGIGIASLTANITDNELAGVTITESGTTDVTEGGATDSYDVVLNSQPETGTTVTITIATTDGQTTTTPTSLLFDDTNWNVAQTVTVTAVDDAAQEGSPHTGSITHTAVSTDANYDGIGIASLTANITDNELAGVTITESGTTDVTEGGATDSYDVVLDSQPEAGKTVTITIATTDGQTTTTPTSLLFDDTNWNVAQSVTVTAVDDAAQEGSPHTGSITHTAVSTDANYDGIGIASLTANITDNELAGVTITESGTTDVTEGGATDSYDVVLNSQPETGTTVTITIATTDGQTTTTPTSLVFDDTNWNVAQSVTVTAVDDADQEGSPHTGSITHTAVSTDANYDGIGIASLTANITDNELAGVTITETGGTTDVTEGGATDSYDVVLDSQPEAGKTVTITIATTDGQTTTAPTSLVFDDTNWNLAQSVTVTAVDDAA